MGRFLYPFLVSSLFSISHAFQPCPILGPVFPLPSKLSSSARLQDAFSNLTEALESGLALENSSHGTVINSTAYAIQLFSLNDEDPLYETYYAGELLTNSTGVKIPSGDSINRVGSISKLFTVYTLLVEIGDTYWDQPVTKFVPELQSHVNRSRSDPINYAAWDQISLGALAGQVAGVTRDLVATNLYSLDSSLAAYGFPPLTPSEIPPCFYNSTTPCNRTEFFAAVDTRQPIYAPNTTPIYSNTAFMILGYALESITGVSFPDMLQRSLIEPLNLTGTSYTKPDDDSRGVVPINATASLWNADLGFGTVMGGIYSSANDLATLGRSILNSTLLPANTTRAWLKPTTFTSSLQGGVGRPWEIYRAIEPRTDIYTKSGDLGLYHSNLALLPDYGVGWTVLAGGSGSHAWIDGLIADIVMPVLEAVARDETEEAYAGSYEATNGLNSSITLTTDAALPGLGISEWISNGTDIFSAIATSYAVLAETVSLRVYPTDLKESSGDGTEVAWRAVIEIASEFQDSSPFAACGSWFGVDGTAYGMHGIDQFVFTVNADGSKAVNVSPVAFKIELERK